MKVITGLLAVLLSVSAFADSYHPHILNSQVVSLDVAAIERHAQGGTPFELDLGAVSLKVSLSPAPVWPKAGLKVVTVSKGGMKESVVTDIITYAGEVEGEDPEESEARFTIAEGALEGYVLSKTGSWYVEPLARFHEKAGADEYLVYATRDLDFVLDFGDDGLNDEIYDPSPTNGDPTWQIPPDEPWQIPVVMVADREYYLHGPSSVTARHASLINMINGIYRRETGREFRMRISFVDADGAFLDETDPYRLLRQLRWFIAHVANADGIPEGQPLKAIENILNSHLAHLTTGKELDGLVYGRADQHGRFSLSQQVRLPFSHETVALSVQKKMLAAHEIGHNFGAMHEAAEEICVDWDLFWCDDYERTLMWREYISDNQPRFSDGTRNGNRNNRKTVRDVMASEAFPPHP